MSPRISAFFPCYNDEHTIGQVVQAAEAALKSLTDDYEIIVINDGSGDGSATVLSGLEAEMPHLRVITHPQNRGYGGALQSGFSAATGDLVFYTDGDGQYDPRELKLLVDALDEGIDLVNGYKTSRSDSWVRRVLGSAYNWVATRLLGIRMRDLDCDFRLFRGEIARGLVLTKTGGIVCAEMMLQVARGGRGIRDVPVSHYPRRFGRSQFFRLSNVISLGLDLALLWWSARGPGRFFRGRAARSDSILPAGKSSGQDGLERIK